MHSSLLEKQTTYYQGISYLHFHFLFIWLQLYITQTVLVIPSYYVVQLPWRGVKFFPKSGYKPAASQAGESDISETLLNSNALAQNLGAIIVYISNVSIQNMLSSHLSFFPFLYQQSYLKLKLVLTLIISLCIKIFSSTRLMLTIRLL